MSSSFSSETTTSPQPIPMDTVPVSNTTPTQRVEAALDELETLAQELEDHDYPVDALDFELPPNFLLSVIIPVFNERDTIARLIGRVRKIPLPLEIIIVDDESKDGTVQKLESLKELVDCTVVFKPKNEGKGAALRSGFEKATGNVVIVQDADLEYDPRDIPKLIRPIVEHEADVVYGSRFLENNAVGSSWMHIFGNRFLTFLSNLTTGLQLTDMETCYKACRRELIQGMELQQNRFGFEPEITAKLARRGARIKELPIRYIARDWDDGKKIGFRDGINAIFCILRYSLG